MIPAVTKTFERLPHAVQVKMVYRDERGRAFKWTRPLGGVNVAMHELDLSDEEICQLLENGDLRGFNIATNPKERPEYRILTRSLDHFKESRGRERLALKWEEIWRLVFGRFTENKGLTGLQIKRGLNCTRQHVASIAPNFTVINEGGQGRGQYAELYDRQRGSLAERETAMNAVVQLAGDANALAIKFGSLLVESEKLCAEGSPNSGKELSKLAGEINRVNGMLNSLYYAAKQTMTAGEFEDFARLSKIDRNLIEDGLRSATEEFTNCHYELSEN